MVCPGFCGIATEDYSPGAEVPWEQLPDKSGMFTGALLYLPLRLYCAHFGNLLWSLGGLGAHTLQLPEHSEVGKSLWALKFQSSFLCRVCSRFLGSCARGAFPFLCPSVCSCAAAPCSWQLLCLSDRVMLKERSDFHLNTFLGPSPALFVPSHLAQVGFCLKKP